ncbi:hypothetical protein A1Q2_08464 [Trichosporon asahii var. asahii CBS 8904]|uniref:F-box domain-containing protein n=1 Tax=Trichosporon asahii var. asahii (strain CBS 8904) TaxID=1220162 RepID=K1VDZ2_TRIAC|nr:hypothetical protein A1Q2_08464 [Trichosporon asahii var. asahii CBS 8904]
MVAFDHRYYPHIIDEILSYLDFGGCFVARNVCKSWRQRTAQLLHAKGHRHLALVCKKDGRVVLKARDINYPPPSLLVHVHPRFPDPWDEPGTPEGWWEPPANDAAVVDVIGGRYALKEGYWLPRFARNARILRWYGPPPCPMEDLNLKHTLFFVQLKPGKKAPRILVDTMRHPTVVTVSVECHADPTAASDSAHFDINSRLTQRIFVILNKPPLAIDAGATSTDSNLLKAPASGSNIDYIYGFINRAGSAQLVTYIVGLELWLPEESALQEFIGSIEQQARKSRAITAEQFSQRCRFLTHAEYEAEVGKETYKLQTRR